ncbi:MAG: hypothetical protein EXS29_00140 [Pedosphaera sp.]|nr:hypothetical protein [Pedosphaera sp.]MSS99713.1 hypothetical protein [Pedosphaera sp.]
MNVTELEKRLLAAARAERPSDRVPYAFEKRVMARIAALPVVDVWALWARSLWRAAVPYALAVACLAVWIHFSAEPATPGDRIAMDFENVVLAAAEESSFESSLEF